MEKQPTCSFIKTTGLIQIHHRKKESIGSDTCPITTPYIRQVPSGKGDEDPHKWLKCCECVTKNNHWDETLYLANIYFCLYKFHKAAVIARRRLIIESPNAVVHLDKESED
ncbi:hypothetical protein LAZ67_18002127 [Cordylochernes scorpioides]|uniref:Uncharacterized protein n=1 Tax=Cordylochernes scorpioides TaxID=51811 RepID=A0ABY6LHU4_9ARAC|nr:hypothetical protein LAZ67_18002127 [Cordylochernes scorpioides]